MDINAATEYAFKNGYKQALQDVLKLELISIETVNKLLSKQGMKPLSN